VDIEIDSGALRGAETGGIHVFGGVPYAAERFP
jgi:carboxylesterase type B